MADPLVAILVDMLREAAERKAAERVERRAKMRLVEQPKRRTAA